MDDAIRETEILVHHGVLPGNGIVLQGRVPVPVSFLDDPVVHGVVHKVQAGGLEKVKVRIGAGEEPYVKVCGIDVYAFRLDGIKVPEGFLHVIHSIGVLQLLSKLD